MQPDPRAAVPRLRTPTRLVPRRRTRALLALALAACAGESDSRGDSNRAVASSSDAADAPACGAVAPHVGTQARRMPVTVQLGAFADSARAAQLADSLTGVRWPAVVVRAAGATPWRVRMAAASDSAFGRLVAHALRLGEHEATLVAASGAHALDAPVVIAVNRGSHGMAARVRWTTSADRCALLVVEDPAAVEAEPVPNGFVLGSERGSSLVQRDSAWDVAPSPDWTRLVYGRAYGLQGRERDSIPLAEWAELARRIGLGTEVVRRGAFVSSGMSLAYAVARPVIVDVASGAEHALPMTGGWRVAWTRDGGAVVLGDGPSLSQDFTPPRRWTVVDAGTPAARSASERARSLGADVERAAVAWVDGPMIDISVTPPDTGVTIAVDGGHVESAGGWIRRTRTTMGGAGASSVRLVGPGVALAATRGGRFVVALVPDPERREYDPPVRLVVYRLPD